MQILKQIGENGGFGDVYEALDDEGNRIAVKKLHSEDRESQERFQKEFRIIKRLNHPNVIKVFDVDVADHNLSYGMPLYQCSLESVIPELPGNYARQYAIITKILDGVEYMHGETVIHRDLKPGNILYNSEIDIVIADFGLCRQTDSDSTRMTHIYGRAFGTYGYMAPEQLIDFSTADERSDIYALGKIIQVIFTGNPSISISMPSVAYVVERCTKANPGERFSSIAELRNAVEAAYAHCLAEELPQTQDTFEKMKGQELSRQDVLHFAQVILNNNEGEEIEKFFSLLGVVEYEYIEQTDLQLLRMLVEGLKNRLTTYGFSFDYVDVIGNYCKKFYMQSKDDSIKAMLLYSIIGVGLDHNRWYVMGIAEDLINQLSQDDSVVVAELTYLLNRNAPYRLQRLDIDEKKLPNSLRPFFLEK